MAIAIEVMLVGLPWLGPWFPPYTLVPDMVAVRGWEDAESEEEYEESKELELVWGLNGGLGGWVQTRREGVRCHKGSWG